MAPISLTPVADIKLEDQDSERVRRNVAEVLRSHAAAIRGLGERATATESALIGAWAVITASADQATIDEAATPDLVTAFDTVSAGATSHGVTVAAGVISLPDNTAGFQWEVHSEVALTHTAAGSAQFQFYQDPANANAAIGLIGIDFSTTHASHLSGSIGAKAWLTGPIAVGLRCVGTTSTNTVTLEAEWSRITCREVKA